LYSSFQPLIMDDAPKVLLRGEETDGQIAVVYLGGGGRPPLHKHDFGETFYIAEGEITFQLGDELVTRRAGEIAVAPHPPDWALQPIPEVTTLGPPIGAK
jgi:quercetin dioxygenase-like cupin family protein